MGIFSRFKDIISANINAMLDKAENPEKLIKLMIKEMEDTLVEIKLACAGTMAERKKVVRMLEGLTAKVEKWQIKAKLALEAGREDLARQAISQKRSIEAEVEQLQRDAAELVDQVDRYQADITQLQEKLDNAKKKHRMLVQRHTYAQNTGKAQRKVRVSTEYDAPLRFEQFENRIEKMEAAVGLHNIGSADVTLEDQFDKLVVDQKVEEELEALKNELKAKGNKVAS